MLWINTCVDMHFRDTRVPFFYVTKHGLSTAHLPASSFPSSYWMPLFSQLSLSLWLQIILQLVCHSCTYCRLGQLETENNGCLLCLSSSNYFQLLTVFCSLQKSAYLKLSILFFQYFCWQNWVQWNKLSGKNTHIIFFYFWFKNKWVWAEKIGKNEKIPKS